MVTRLIWTIWTSMSAIPRKAVKFNHSLTHSLDQWWPSSLMHIYGTRGRWVDCYWNEWTTDQLYKWSCKFYLNLNNNIQHFTSSFYNITTIYVTTIITWSSHWSCEIHHILVNVLSWRRRVFFHNYACHSVLIAQLHDSFNSLWPWDTTWQNRSGAHFTNNFSITIQMWWKFHFALIQILMKWSLQNLAHGTTAELSWHVPNFVAIWSPVIELELNEISIEFELWWKNC